MHGNSKAMPALLNSAGANTRTSPASSIISCASSFSRRPACSLSLRTPGARPTAPSLFADQHEQIEPGVHEPEVDKAE